MGKSIDCEEFNHEWTVTHFDVYSIVYENYSCLQRIESVVGPGINFIIISDVVGIMSKTLKHIHHV